MLHINGCERFKSVLSHLFLNQDSFCKGDNLWSFLFHITHFDIGNHLHGSEIQNYKKVTARILFSISVHCLLRSPPQEAAQVIQFLVYHSGYIYEFLSKYT